VKAKTTRVAAMQSIKTVNALRGLQPLFLEGLMAPEIDAVVSCANERRFLGNSVIVNQGHPADRLFLLTSGLARHFLISPAGQKIVLLWLTPGEIFGGPALLSIPSNDLVSTEAVKNSCALVWDRTTARELALRYPRLLDNALLIAFNYLVAYRDIHIGLTWQSARQRLAQMLVNLGNAIGKRVPQGIELDLTNDELANAATLTPFTTSRLLGEWQRHGLLVKSRRKLLLRSPERLLMQESLS